MPRPAAGLVGLDDDPGGSLTLIERTVPVDLHNEDYIALLIERLSWAVIDAERLESQSNRDDAERQPRREPCGSPTFMPFASSSWSGGGMWTASPTCATRCS